MKDVEATTRWLELSSDFQRTIKFVLGVIHPELYQTGSRILEDSHQSTNPAISFWANKWSSVFTATSVIVSRTALSHFDRYGDNKYFDALVSFGSSNVCLRLPQISAEFEYGLGGGIFFSGSLFQHEVPEWKHGNRINYSSFMRPEVVNQFCSPVGWAKPM